MTVISKSLFQAAYIATTPQLVYRAESVTGKVEAATVTNSSDIDATVSVYAVESGGSPDASNQIVKAQRVRPEEAYLLPELRGQTFEAGDEIYAVASAGSAIVMRLSGLEIT